MSRLRLLSVVALAFAMIAVIAAPALGKALPRPQTWVDEELFDGVVTPTSFKPTSGNFDELYTGCDDEGGFKDGVNLISDAGPGDTNYNGGRWHVNVIAEPVTINCAKYADADSVNDLDTADFISTNVYFECPLLPRRGGGPPNG